MTTNTKWRGVGRARTRCVICSREFYRRPSKQRAAGNACSVGACRNALISLRQTGIPRYRQTVGGDQLLALLLRSTRRVGDCLVWTGPVNRDGYGISKRLGERLVHRIIWRLRGGTIPKGEGVLHTCDNPPCVEELHMFTGSQYSNMRDAASKNRTAYGVRHGQAKLNDDVVSAARKEAKAGASISSIAARYGVVATVMGKAIRRQTWRRVEEPCRE